MNSAIGPVSRHEIGLLAILALVPLFPFLSAAISIDGPVFIAVAQQIVTNPVDPFGFDMIWDPTSPWVAEFNRNPPLLSYYLAPWIAWLGEREIVVHAALLPFPLIAALSFYGIARRLVRDGFAAAALLVVTPAFLVLSTTVMLDVPVVAGMLFSVYAFLRALEGEASGPGRTRWEFAAGCAVAATGLTKYVGFSMLPLLAAGAVLLMPQWKLSLLRMLSVPVVVWGLWGAYTAHSYGEIHFLASADLLREKDFLPSNFWNQVATTVVYHGAALVFPIALWLRALFTRNRTGIAVIGVLLGAAVVNLVVSEGHPPRRVSIGIEEALLAAVGFAGTVFLWAHCLSPKRLLASALDRWLALWLGGFVFFTMFLNWHVNAADALLVAPPLLLLWFRSPELRPSRRFVAVSVASMLPLSIALAWADSHQAGFYRSVAAEIADEIGDSPGQRWFVGNWGLQYYLEREGFRAVVPIQYEQTYGESALSVGDWVASARNTSQLDVKSNLGRYRMRVKRTWRHESWLPLRTTNPDAGAGFYSHHAGHVPFAWSRVPVEQMGLGQVIGRNRSFTAPLR
ncbi:MAG: glycosyltransferase family 39 protein [Myxococcota bacterium]